MDLVDFLRARLAEDVALAATASPGPWHVNAESDEVLADDGITVAEGFALSGNQLRATTQHIARHDPVRILAEAEVQRMLLDSIVPTMNDFEDKIDEEWGTDEGEHASAAFLRAWARVYRGHPDFDPVWLEV